MKKSANHLHSLIDTAMRRQAADLVIKNGQWVCVQSGEILPGTDIAVKNGLIAYAGPDAGYTIGPDTQVIDAAGRYLVPGLIDAHMHVESGMLTVTEFVRAVLPYGTTAMFIDPHEIANVFGLKGVRLMLEDAQVQPIHIWVQIPSCVPSAPGMETPGATLGAPEIAEALKWDGVIGLGEMMNFPGVAAGDPKVLAELSEAMEAGKTIGGHYPSTDLGLAFHGYAAAGIEDDHEGTRKEDAIARVRQGMKVMLRFGSGWHDVAEGVRAITEDGLDPRHFILCTDDSHSETLVNDGHVNRALQQAIAQGVAPVVAIQMATINAADHFGMSREIGQIAPGRSADILLVENLEQFKADLVIARGKIVAQAGKLVIDLPARQYPDWATQSVHLPRELTTADFRLPVPAHLLDSPQVIANVIGVIENQAPTRHLRRIVIPQSGEIQLDPAQNLAKVAVVERHFGTGRIQVGLVQGFGLNVPCAIGSTVAHDSHQMLIIGTDDADMALAANELKRTGGGQVVIREGRIIGQVELPIAGIISSERADIVAQKASTVLQGFRECGCQMNNPNMQLSLLALVVIPELRLSDLGLVDVNSFQMIPVIESLPSQ